MKHTQLFYFIYLKTKQRVDDIIKDFCHQHSNCIEDSSRTYYRNGRPHYAPAEISIKESRLLAEEMEPEAKVDANISSKNDCTIMTVSIATVFTALAIVVASF